MKSEFGTEILNNKANVLLFLEKFFPSGKSEYSFVSNLFASGFMDILFRLQNSFAVIKTNMIKQIENQFASQYGISGEWSEYIVGCVCNFLGLSNSVEHSIIKLKLAAGTGHTQSQFELAKCYHNGQGVQRNQEKYLEWLKKQQIVVFLMQWSYWEKSILKVIYALKIYLIDAEITQDPHILQNLLDWRIVI